MSDSVYTPKNILCTGGAGFIGSHVVIHLVKKYPQYKIVNLDKLDACSSLHYLDEVQDEPNYKFVKGDICSIDLVNFVMKNEEIDTVIHLAAATHVDNSFANSIEFTQNNVMGTHVMLECARTNEIKRFIHVSTDEVYGESKEDDPGAEDGTFFRPGTALDPTNPYAATKAGAEFMVKAYNRSYRLPVIITRGNNVYGPHQFPEKVIPKFINLLMRDRKCCIHGDGTNRRNFVFVKDVARAFDIVVHKGHLGNIYNIGTRFEISNKDLAEMLIKKFGKDPKDYIEYVEDRKFNDFRYSINFEKLEQLGWRAEVEWDEGLDSTIEWYKTTGAKEDMWETDISSVLKPHPHLHN